MSSSSDSTYRQPSQKAVAALTALLEGVIEVVESWSEKDLEAFLSGERDLVLRAKPRRTGGRRRKRTTAPEVDANMVREEMSGLTTREAGLEYLDQLDLNRESLRRLTGALDLPSTSADTTDRLRDRIVEALIGYRLRSSAVRGDEPSSSSRPLSAD